MLQELTQNDSIIRISPEIDVPVTHRIMRIVDSAAFRRLARISQLGLVSLVYPGATHTRFEHSLGVYRNARDFLRQVFFGTSPNLDIDDHHCSLFLVSALLHDIGHWPFCHSIEDIRLVNFPKHEILADRLLQHRELATLLRDDWGIEPAEVSDFLHPKSKVGLDPTIQVLRSMLSGPIDVDKLDYLERDSLHAGVPYGRNFDRNRLVSTLCIDQPRHRLAITEKGKTAAEMMVFARYVMFSEVYWHHAVRSATAMLQRVVYELRENLELVEAWLDMDDATMRESLMTNSYGKPWEACASGLFGHRRLLYKRVAQYDCLTHPELHRALARKSYPEIVTISQRLAELLSSRCGIAIGKHDVIVDAPPVKLEVQFDMHVKTREGELRPLCDLSPVVRSLAVEQFDDLVKRVRVFVAPGLRDQIPGTVVTEMLHEIIASR